MKAYPDNIKEISFLATLDRGAPYRPWFAALGATAYWGIGLFGTRPPRRLRRRPSAGRAGHRHEHRARRRRSTRTPTSTTTTRASSAPSSGPPSRTAPRSRTTSSWSAPSGSATAGSAGCGTPTAATRTPLGPRPRQRVRPLRRRAQRRLGPHDRHRIVYSKGIHLVVPRLTTTRHDRVLAFFDDTRRLFFVIPMGPARDWHDRHARRHARHPVTDEDREFLLDQINERLTCRGRSPTTTSSPSGPACGRSSSAARAATTTTRLDLAEPQARDRARRRARVVTVFGGKLTDCLNVGEEVADESRRSASRSSRTAQLVRGAGPATRTEFFRQARLMRLDALRSARPSRSRPALASLRPQAFACSRKFARPTMARTSGSAEYLRCEIAHAAEREMVVTLDDFLRRR